MHDVKLKLKSVWWHFTRRLNDIVFEKRFTYINVFVKICALKEFEGIMRAELRNASFSFFSLSPHVSLSLFNSGDAASESLFEGSKLDEHLFVRKIKRYWSLKAMQTRAEMGRATTRRAIPFPICEGRNPLKYKINRPSVRPISIQFERRNRIQRTITHRWITFYF